MGFTLSIYPEEEPNKCVGNDHKFQGYVKYEDCKASIDCLYDILEKAVKKLKQNKYILFTDKLNRRLSTWIIDELQNKTGQKNRKRTFQEKKKKEKEKANQVSSSFSSSETTTKSSPIILALISSKIAANFSAKLRLKIYEKVQ